MPDTEEGYVDAFWKEASRIVEEYRAKKQAEQAERENIPPVAIPPVFSRLPYFSLETKETNPKDAVGSDKVPLHLWPSIATIHGALALLDGALKYGRSNWRESGVRASIYRDAIGRHLDKWFEGEDHDPDSGLSHLAHALASLAILLDAQAAGELTDDRMYKGRGSADYEALTGNVARLKEKHRDRKPKHFDRRNEPE